MTGYSYVYHVASYAIQCEQLAELSIQGLIQKFNQESLKFHDDLSYIATALATIQLAADYKAMATCGGMRECQPIAFIVCKGHSASSWHNHAPRKFFKFVHLRLNLAAVLTEKLQSSPYSQVVNVQTSYPPLDRSLLSYI